MGATNADVTRSAICIPAWLRAQEQITARILYPAIHSSMPAWNQWFTRDELADITALILSLEGS